MTTIISPGFFWFDSYVKAVFRCFEYIINVYYQCFSEAVSQLLRFQATND